MSLKPAIALKAKLILGNIQHGRPAMYGSIRRDMMNKQLLKDSIGWGVILWLIGYFLGFTFFFILPVSMIGWAVMPIGLVITLWVLFKKVEADSFRCYLILAVVWTAIAIAFDYLFIIKVLNPADGYYKLDVYLYYALTFMSPLIVGWWKTKWHKSPIT